MSRSRGSRSALATGREALGVTLRAAQRHLQKVFILFLLGLVGTIYFMRRFGWDILRNVTTARMDAATADQFDVIVRTPFDVILLQVKLGLLVGILLIVPILGYYIRDALQARGRWPDTGLSLGKALLLVFLSIVLFVAGVSYAYFVFFPVAFNFLTTYTINTGFNPTYDIVKWTNFFLLLTISFGLAAQMPLIMSALSYSEIVPYEYFREKWRHAALLIFLFGAVFSPPDPFTQIMWAVPLLVLYGMSLYLAKFVTAIHRGGQTMVKAKLKRNWRKVVGPFAVVGVGTYVGVQAGALAWLNANVIAAIPADLRPGALSTAPFPGTGTVELVVASAVVGAIAAFPFLIYYAWPELQPRGSRGDPANIDVGELPAEGVRAAPIEAFLEMSENKAVKLARRAMDAGDTEKAQAILDRFDEAEEVKEREEETEYNMAEDMAAQRDRSTGDVAKETTGNMLSAFTGDDTSEEEIGGYAYDLAFILESLTSKSFRVVFVFMASTMLAFFALYGGAFAALKEDFLARIPPQMVAEVDIVALHPVEALLFEVKMSLIIGVVLTLPVLAYYVWPAVEERFYGITRTFETPSPMDAALAHWNKLAAFFVLFAAIAYVALTGYADALSLSLPSQTVTVAGFAVTPTYVLYGMAASAGLVGTLPAAVYYAWPSIRERRQADSKRNAFILWGGTLVGGVVIGSALGYLYIAPVVISYFVYDAINAGMIITYTINDFFWLVFLTTIGIGLLAEVPLTMWLFHYTGIVSYEQMRRRWRGVVFIVFIAAALFTNRSVITMLIFGVPVTFMYWVGLTGLYFRTLPSRLLGRSKAAAEE